MTALGGLTHLLVLRFSNAHAVYMQFISSLLLSLTFRNFEILKKGPGGRQR